MSVVPTMAFPWDDINNNILRNRKGDVSTSFLIITGREQSFYEFRTYPFFCSGNLNNFNISIDSRVTISPDMLKT
jgi:hypothetical protein